MEKTLSKIAIFLRPLLWPLVFVGIVAFVLEVFEFDFVDRGLGNSIGLVMLWATGLLFLIFSYGKMGVDSIHPILRKWYQVIIPAYFAILVLLSLVAFGKYLGNIVG